MEICLLIQIALVGVVMQLPTSTYLFDILFKLNI